MDRFFTSYKEIGIVILVQEFLLFYSTVVTARKSLSTVDISQRRTQNLTNPTIYLFINNHMFDVSVLDIQVNGGEFLNSLGL